MTTLVTTLLVISNDWQNWWDNQVLWTKDRKKEKVAYQKAKEAILQFFFNTIYYQIFSDTLNTEFHENIPECCKAHGFMVLIPIKKYDTGFILII